MREKEKGSRKFERVAAYWAHVQEVAQEIPVGHPEHQLGTFAECALDSGISHVSWI